MVNINQISTWIALVLTRDVSIDQVSTDQSRVPRRRHREVCGRRLVPPLPAWSKRGSGHLQGRYPRVGEEARVQEQRHE